jgi:hypothetical protein
MTVDGEIFEVSRTPRGADEYKWITGPNKGYGFGSLRSDLSVATDEEHEQAIREFLAEIDPETGFID